MATRKKVDVFVCDECGKEYTTPVKADECKAREIADAKFPALLKRYKALQNDVRRFCRHSNEKRIAREDTFDMCDSRYTQSTYHCPDCDRVRQD
ncbi:MAG: hypothetical protein HY225_03200 [Candidatus Vogelbacteria bacterium]|nr:hypothetical protein [Candidatus Vogelbacteria bacterium]